MLDEAIELAAESGAHEVVIGMAHRGRLNALVHTVGRSYESILREFEGERSLDALLIDPEGGSGDVKYHLPATGARVTRAGEVEVIIAPNPSHLEAVDPVVEGRARAEQTDRSAGAGLHDPTVALPILIHGDASFAGQGVVAETLNLQSLDGYSTGGTLHVIANNQVGFTTDPAESRSTRYSSDLAKGFDVPIVHVNADDPEAALSAVRLALAYRAEFGHDFVIDLVGYRRFGHNEQDEAVVHAAADGGADPAAADGARAVRRPARRRGGARPPRRPTALVDEVTATLRAAHERLRASIGTASVTSRRPEPRPSALDGRRRRDRGRRRAARRAQRAAARACPSASRSTRSSRSSSTVGARRSTRAGSTGARPRRSRSRRCSRTASRSGSPARTPSAGRSRTATSSSTIPGTGETLRADPAPPRRERLVRGLQLAALGVRRARLRVRVLGRRPRRARALGGAVRRLRQRRADRDRPVPRRRPLEVGADLAAHAAAARTATRATGPEHSSARLERFLQLGAQDNIRVANCSTAAQFFHLLRRQALDAVARPLVVMTPKGLLRLRHAGVDRSTTSRGARSSRCSTTRTSTSTPSTGSCSARGRSTTTSSATRSAAARRGVAVARVEQLYPFPVDALTAVIAALPVAARDRLGAGGAAEHGRLALDPPPARRGRARRVGRAGGHVRRPDVEGEPERGLPDGAPARAGPDRAGRARRRAER